MYINVKHSKKVSRENLYTVPFMKTLYFLKISNEVNQRASDFIG